MKVLFVMCRESTDHLASCLWDGLQEILGWENVVDAVSHRLLSHADAGECYYAEQFGDGSVNRFGRKDVLSSIGARRPAKRLEDGDGDFDLLVLNAAFLREYDWPWAHQFTARLCPGAKVAYVEGWDSAHEVHPPQFHVDAVFRKEIDPGHRYPYEPKYLSFAAPARWFHENDLAGDRPIDVFYSGTTHSNAARWQTLAAVFQTARAHHSVVSSKHLGICVPDYFGFYRRSKIALCPASAEGADSLRTYEAVACGAVPLFVGYPDRERGPWLNGMAFRCAGPSEVAAHVEAALDRDLPAMRHALWHHAKKHHTTRARAQTLLEGVGLG